MSSTGERIRYDLALLGEAYTRFTRHGGDSLAAGVAFGMLLSMAPLLVVSVAVASVAVGDGSARHEVIDLVREGLGRQGADLVGDWVDQARAWSGTATAIGIAGFLVGAARLVGIIDAAFDAVFEAPRVALTFRQSLRSFFVTQATGLGVTLLAGLIVALSVLLRALSASALGVVDDAPITFAIGALRTVGSFGLLALALGILYRALPPVRLTREDVVEGAVVTALLLDGATWALSLLIERIDVAAPYGAAGAVVAALVWLFVAASLFLFGAEITAERADRRRHARALQMAPPPQVVVAPAAVAAPPRAVTVAPAAAQRV